MTALELHGDEILAKKWTQIALCFGFLSTMVNANIEDMADPITDPKSKQRQLLEQSLPVAKLGPAESGHVLRRRASRTTKRRDRFYIKK